MTTLSLSDDAEDEKEDCDSVEPLVQSTSFQWNNESCEAPTASPVRTARRNDRLVLLNTRNSLLVDETDDEIDDDDDDEDEGDYAETSEYYEHLVNLNFRLEMEEHARAATMEILSPVFSEGFHSVSPTSPRLYAAASQATATTTQASSARTPEQTTLVVPKQSFSILDTVTEGLDALCLPRKGICGRTNHTTSIVQTSSSDPVLYEANVQQDILRVMGCASPPDDEEIATLWEMDSSWPTWQAWQASCLLPPDSPRRLVYSPVPGTPEGPHRPGPRERVMRLRRWRRERLLPVPNIPERAHSMDIFDEANRVPNVQGDWEDDKTYDSDPEMSVSMRAKNSTEKRQPSTPQRKPPTKRWAVRECMNRNWELVWHTEKSALAVRTWMERGTIVGTQMFEPALVWRNGDKHTQLRFLNICRILPASPEDLRKESILARPSCTLRLFTSDGEQYFLEAPSSAKRTEIIDSWKMCIARFATLAVLEDLDNIQKEFFHPTSHSYVPDMEEIMDDIERDRRNDV